MTTYNPKKVLILGATGPAGILTTRKALDHSHLVTVYARNPSKLPADIKDSKNLKVIKGELADSEQLSKAIEGQDVIISLLGPTGALVGTPFTDAYRLVFPLMKQSGIKRIIAMGTPSIHDPEDGFSIVALLLVTIIRLFINSAFKDIVSFGKLFDTEATAAGLDWTMFRVGFLSDAAAKLPKTCYVGKSGWSAKIHREDIAIWLVDELEKEKSEWSRKKPALWS